MVVLVENTQATLLGMEDLEEVRPDGIIQMQLILDLALLVRVIMEVAQLS